MLFVVENCHPKICDFTKIIRIVTKKFNFTNKNYFSCSRKKKFNEAVKTKKRLSRLELKKLIFNSLGTKKIEFDTKPTARKKKKRIVEVEMPHIENIKVENTAREFSTDSNNKESTPIDEVDIKYEEFDRSSGKRVSIFLTNFDIKINKIHPQKHFSYKKKVQTSKYFTKCGHLEE